MTLLYIPTSPPVKNAIFTFYTCLISQADTDIFQANPTLAAGDVKVSIDGAAFVNITSLPTAIASATKVLSVSLTAAEMNGSTIIILFSDAAGSEWQDAMIELATETVIGIEAALGTTPVDGATLNMTIDVTYAATITGLTIPVTWSKMYLTVKEHKSDPDSRAVLQIMETNPADGVNDGIMYLNKAVATVVTKAYGSLTVVQAAGTVSIAVTDEGMGYIPKGKYSYDLKCLLADGTSQVLSASAECNVAYTDTHVI